MQPPKPKYLVALVCRCGVAALFWVLLTSCTANESWIQEYETAQSELRTTQVDGILYDTMVILYENRNLESRNEYFFTSEGRSFIVTRKREWFGTTVTIQEDIVAPKQIFTPEQQQIMEATIRQIQLTPHKAMQMARQYLVDSGRLDPHIQGTTIRLDLQINAVEGNRAFWRVSFTQADRRQVVIVNAERSTVVHYQDIKMP
jgi:hypothetical protein